MKLGSKHVTFCAFWKKAKKIKNVGFCQYVGDFSPNCTRKKPKNDGFLIISIVLENLS